MELNVVNDEFVLSLGNPEIRTELMSPKGPFLFFTRSTGLGSYLTKSSVPTNVIQLILEWMRRPEIAWLPRV